MVDSTSVDSYIFVQRIEIITIMNRPFVYGYLAGKENFIDREEDRRQLKTFPAHGINVMLVSPRRWGKSSLGKMAMEELMSEDKDVRVTTSFALSTPSSCYGLNSNTISIAV